MDLHRLPVSRIFPDGATDAETIFTQSGLEQNYKVRYINVVIN
jgi:hypothetical protein